VTYKTKPARCPHCGELYKRLLVHQPHCKKNPNRVPGYRAKPRT